MSAQVAADLRAAAQVLRRDGWVQEKYVSPDGCHCLVGAIAAALGGDQGEGSVPAKNQTRLRDARRLLATHLGDLATDWWGDLIDWNDDDERTAAEVIAALEAAADKADEQ